MKNRPDDLITIATGAKLADRGKSTVRLWVRKGLISGYKKNPKNKNSTLLVSQAEIMAHLAVNGKINPPRPKSIDEISVSAEQWLTEKELLLEKISSLEREKELMNQLLIQAQENTKTHELMNRQLISARELAESELNRQIKAFELAEEKNMRLSKRMDELTVYMSMPWWKRWSLNTPLLTVSGD